MHTYINTLRSDDGRTPRFRDPMARLVLVCEMIEAESGVRANSLPEKNKKIYYSDPRLCPIPQPPSLQHSVVGLTSTRPRSIAR